MDRYLANNNGRFQSPDTKGDPRLFKPAMLNRYVYTSNDPVNHLDPSGNAEVGSVIPTPFSPTQRPDCFDPMVMNWRVNLPICEPTLSVAIAWLPPIILQRGRIRAPSIYLKLETDCITMNNPATGGPTRDRTYQAYDENGPIGGTITERVTHAATGELADDIIGNPTSSGVPGSGVFRDQLGLGLFQTGTAFLHQTFVISLSGGPNMPTFVRTPSGDFGTLAIQMSAVWIDGKKVYDVKYSTGPGKWDDGMWNKDGSPRLPLCK